MSFLLGALCACQIVAATPRSDAATATSELVALARTARYQQDSALATYVVLAKQRWSAGIGLAAAGGLGPIGRTRLGARFESIARMGWHHERGAWAELIASRAVAPIVGEVEPSEADDDIVFVLPYYPGRDRLWPMTELAGALEDTFDEFREWIAHPLDAGSDSLYRFSLGGSLAITLPGGKQVQLRELQVRPVRPSDRLIVGSLWLDIADGSLVRAAYRPSTPVDLWPMMEPNFDSDDREMISKFGPFRGNVEEVVIEHGLYAERFWLPRVRIAHAEGTAKGGRVTISIEQTFEYEHVAALREGEVQAAQPAFTSEDTRRDDLARYEEWRARSRRTRPCREYGDRGSRRYFMDSLPLVDELSTRFSDGVRVRVIMPCDRDRLINSPELPASIYGSSEELFTEQDLGQLRQEVGQALALSSQAEWSPQPATLRYGLDDGLLRYNRIEALSAGVGAEKLLGDGYTLDAVARIGLADLQPNAELRVRRGNGRGELRAAVYRRLDAANDWGNPLSVSSSLGALLLGRDYGSYYRSYGVELGGTHHRISGGPAISWRLFHEQQTSAHTETSFSMARVTSGTLFGPNITAASGAFSGGAATMTFALGTDPYGTQLSGSLKAEAAGGAMEYGRGAVEFRLARGLGRGTLGSITAATGGSVGELPAQRHFYLGGPQAIHAHRAGSPSGDAFWMGRAELTKGFPLIRPIIFGDVGWAGDRRSWRTSQQRAIAAGFGAAALDGMLRFDISRAMDSSKRWSFDIFIEVR